MNLTSAELINLLLAVSSRINSLSETHPAATRDARTQWEIDNLESALTKLEHERSRQTT